MRYGYIGSMKAKPGHRDDVVAILLSGVEFRVAASCAAEPCRVGEGVMGWRPPTRPPAGSPGTISAEAAVGNHEGARLVARTA